MLDVACDELPCIGYVAQFVDPDGDAPGGTDLWKDLSDVLGEGPESLTLYATERREAGMVIHALALWPRDDASAEATRARVEVRSKDALTALEEP